MDTIYLKADIVMVQEALSLGIKEKLEFIQKKQ